MNIVTLLIMNGVILLIMNIVSLVILVNIFQKLLKMLSQQRHSYMELQQLELQININIGPNQHYVLEVPKHSNLSQIVHQFLKEHRLSLNYHNSILHLVKKELQKRALISNSYSSTNPGNTRASRKKIWNQRNQQVHREKSQLSEMTQFSKKDNTEGKARTANYNKKQNYQHSDSKVMNLQGTAVQRQQNLDFNQRDTFDQLKKIKEQIQQKKQNSKHMINQKMDQKMDQSPIKDFQKYSQINQTNKTNRTHLQKKFEDISIANYQEQQKTDKTEVEEAYESWKRKEKVKEVDAKSKTPRKSLQMKSQNATLKGNKTDSKIREQFQNQNEGKRQQKKHELSPTYFYKRGLLIEKLKEEQKSRKFKEIYPFQITQNIQISEQDKDKLHNRLFKQGQAKNIKKLENQMRKAKRSPHFQHSRDKEYQNDPYKEKVTKKRIIIDKILTQCIQQKKVGQKSQIRSVSKSPFRKTMAY